MPESKSAVQALDELTAANAALMLAVSNARPGTRLVALKDLIDGVQQKVSRLNALLTLRPAMTLEYEEGREYEADELAEIDGLNELMKMSIPEELPGRLKVRLRDGRLFASTLEGLDSREVTVRWSAGERVAEIDLSDVLYPLLDLLDPEGEDVPGYWASTDDQDDEA